MWKEGGIYFSEISREEAILFIESVIVVSHVILLKGKWTLAMSSVFLNSPSMSVTFPFTSNSVHRSFNSLPAFPVLLRPIFAPSKPSRKLGSGGKSAVLRPVLSLGSFSFHNLLSKGRLSVEPCRLVGLGLAWDMSFCLCALAKVKGYTGAFLVLGLRKSRLSRDDSTVAWC